MATVTVQVQDQFGNASSTSGVTVNLAVSAGTIASGNSTTTAANGLATFSAIKINIVATGLTLIGVGEWPDRVDSGVLAVQRDAGGREQARLRAGPVERGRRGRRWRLR